MAHPPSTAFDREHATIIDSTTVSRSGNEHEYIDVVARGGKECKVLSTKYMYMNRGWLVVADQVTGTNRDRQQSRQSDSHGNAAENDKIG